jgi:hypothetical protein
MLGIDGRGGVFWHAAPNYAFERSGLLSSRARVRQLQSLRPSARLKRMRPAAQRER